MELISKIKISSTTWEESRPLQDIICIRKSSGIILEEPFKREDETPLTLKHPSHSDEQTCCYIHINTTHLMGYYNTGLQLTSGARTVEYYNGQNQEYIGTVRGTLVDLEGKSNDRLYLCNIDLPSEDLQTELILKLLSLKGKDEVVVNQVCLVVMEDIGGKSTMNDTISDTNGTSNVDMQDIFSMLQHHQNVPPFLTSLISALQSSSHSSDDIGHMTDMFRHMRPALPTSKKEMEQEKKEELMKEEDKSNKETKKSYEDSEGGESNDWIELERKVKEYIDLKFAELKEYVDNQLKDMKQELKAEIIDIKK